MAAMNPIVKAALGIAACAADRILSGPPFSEREAERFIASWSPETSAPPAGEQPTGVGVTGPDAGAAAPPEWDTSVLLTAAAHLIATLTGPQPVLTPDGRSTRRRLQREYATQLIAELRDRAAQFEAVQD